ncbi:hypothetical protein AS594_07025 [Streptomyces agglomeratus]|uniref:Uncharacterized protein n=1 Tax=Streptomyces agglomeratus TaxID=285458 RepID=A0A1E5P4K6_9ACTN|nr:hypothetical protein [Streptomyces agglomeratus]OEJ24274.1 hypothetical protein AS594_07025 [Streptomyces agglomeratus]
MPNSVSFECQSNAEADRIRYAVNLHRHALKQQGIDPRNYAPAIPGFAGFGWDTVVRAAQDMSKGSITHMSYRIADALRTALVGLAQRTPDRDTHLAATRTAERLAALTGVTEV